jgi:formylglycine-generating enzyme required for sulfatase activity
MHASSPPLRRPDRARPERGANPAFLFAVATSLLAADDGRSTGTDDMILIAGGTFQMGDILGEGSPRERPVHRVTLGEFYLGNYEITVKAFRRFVEETGYVTSAEWGGAWCLDPETGAFTVRPEASWRNPGFAQDDEHPVTCVSWLDAIRYCNWLSRTEALPPAYDPATGALLDERGAVTADVTRVKGYRLPTEAEWEYAARGGGKTVRYGNGRNLARAGEINFDARVAGPHAERGPCRQATEPVGSFKPNDLGLFDMAGNVWEWCSDFAGPYAAEDQANPYGAGGTETRRAARGGRWGGGPDELRVSARFGWAAHERCNNIGFRVARSR